MRPALALALVALALVGCGGDDDEPSASAPEPSGATGAGGAASEITVGEFIAELAPQKKEILATLVAGSEACEGVVANSSFVLLVTDAAIDADPDEPLAGLVEEQCG